MEQLYCIKHYIDRERDLLLKRMSSVSVHLIKNEINSAILRNKNITWNDKTCEMWIFYVIAPFSSAVWTNHTLCDNKIKLVAILWNWWLNNEQRALKRRMRTCHLSFVSVIFTEISWIIDTCPILYNKPKFNYDIPAQMVTYLIRSLCPISSIHNMLS